MGIGNPIGPCPLCQGDCHFFYQDTRRSFLRCKQCALVFVSPEFLPTQKEEKTQYDLHENHPEDDGYRNFLNRLAWPLLEKLKPKSSGLDFGCGPGPTLSVILEEAGHNLSLYDPIYHPDKRNLSGTYDFITATEVFEHLHYPSIDLGIIQNALKPGGWLGIMTKRVSGREAFSKWHYIQDPTHVCFWSETTFNWLASKWNANVEYPASDIAIIQNI